MELSELGKSALAYAKIGLRVFPVKPRDKIPLGAAAPHGCLDATLDVDRITAWWSEFPEANVGIACGNGLVVLDVDAGHGGEDSLEEIEREHGKLPDTPMVLTGGGGQHRYYSTPTAKNKVGLYPGIDVRGDGGYVLAPPSVHPSGKEYIWELSSRLVPPKAVKVAPAPSWMLAGSKRGEGNGSTVDRIDPDEVFEGIAAGERHDRLFRYACRLRTQNMRESEAVVLLREACRKCTPPYLDETPEKIVSDAWKFPPGDSALFAKLLDTEEPIITTDVRSITMEWPKYGAKATAKTLKEDARGWISGHLAVECTLPGLKRPLRSAHFTFTSIPARKELAKDLLEKLPAPWDNLIESFCTEVTNYVQRGEAIEEVDIDDVPPDAGFLLFPVIGAGHPTVLFGAPGTGKSFLAQWWAMLLLGGVSLPEMAVQVHTKAKTVLYLDWEGDKLAFQRRGRSIREGTALGVSGLRYRRCTRPLASDVDQIRNSMEDFTPDLIVIDSLAPATGGDLNSSGPPNEFFTALRSLGGTALILAHTSKGAAGTSSASIFGSVFFTALARSVWQIRSDSQAGEDQMSIALFHAKVNYGRIEHPFGLTIYHSETATWFGPGLVDDVTSAATARSLKDQILRALSQLGSTTAPDLADALGEPQNKVRVILGRLSDDGLVSRIGVGRGQKWSRVAVDYSNEHE